MIALRLGQSCAIPFFHDFSEAGRTSFFNKSQSLNAPFPILITEFGTLIVSIADIQENTLSPIFFKDEGRITFLAFGKYVNEFFPNDVIPSPITIFFIQSFSILSK